MSATRRGARTWSSAETDRHAREGLAATDAEQPNVRAEPRQGGLRPGFAVSFPPAVTDLLERLWAAGHSAYVVGGSLRDALLGREASDWDLTTDARPERIQAIFRRSLYRNRYGTVVVRRAGNEYEITTFRTDHDYADHRRPHRIEFGERVQDDLARRDFTVNAMAWGAEAAQRDRPELIDPFDGRSDADRRILRAVGEPGARFAEDALRMIRAVRLAAVLGFEIEPATLHGIVDNAPLAAHLSGERIAGELERLLAAPRPSVGLRLMADTGLLAVVAPELAAERGVSQNKIPGEDLWEHTLRSVDAAPVSRPIVRLAALLHDVGKPLTAADGHFLHHDAVGAGLADALLRRWHLARSIADPVVFLVRQHMFSYEPSWSDAAVRRFLGKIGIGALDDLFALREADNIGSGLPAETEDLAELRRRVEEQLAAQVALDLHALAVDGNDLMEELSLPQSPAVGRILRALLERVIADPSKNDRATLLRLARDMARAGR